MADAEVLLITTEQPPTGKVKETKGLVVAARPVSIAVAAADEELEALLQKLRSEAAKKGANAVLGVRIDVRRVIGAGLEWVLLLAYGTAVVLE